MTGRHATSRLITLETALHRTVPYLIVYWLLERSYVRLITVIMAIINFIYRDTCQACKTVKQNYYHNVELDIYST